MVLPNIRQKCFTFVIRIECLRKRMVEKKKNPFAFKSEKAMEKKKASGKRIGKSKPGKANNQQNRRVK